MSRLLVDDVTKTDARALLNVNKMATISDIVAPSNEYIYALSLIHISEPTRRS